MGSIAIALTLLLTAAAVPVSTGAEEIQDVRLEVRQLTRPAGKQSAKLSGRLAPSGQVRRVTALVEVDGRAATLTGKIGRSGRMSLVGRHLDLASALVTFDRIEVTLSDGSIDALTFVAGDCERTINGRTLDCRSATGPTGDLLDGVYDATLVFNGSSPIAGLGRVGTATDGSRLLALHQTDLDSASVTMASDGNLSGYYIWGGDAFFTVAGSAEDESSPSASRLIGSVSSTNAQSVQLAFDVERPVTGTPATLGGSWVIRLAPSDWSVTLALTVAADGVAASAPTTIYGAGGEPRYTIRAGTCAVAPQGGVYCLLGVDSPPGVQEFRVHGRLDIAAGSGSGTYTLGPPPVIISRGSWTATR